MLVNHSPFAALLHPHLDEHDRPGRLLLVKGVFELGDSRLSDSAAEGALRLPAQRCRLGDLRLDAVQRQALGDRLADEIDWLPGDLAPPKPRFDFIVSGYAHSPGGAESTGFLAGVRAAAGQVLLLACAPRWWQGTSLRCRPGHPERGVRTVPLHPAVSFGGADGGPQALDNPGGLGFHPGDAEATRAPMPWLEHPDAVVEHPVQRPLPMAFGPWPENAWHRRVHMGTWDDAWRRQRAPRPPVDFSARFHNLAHPSLQWVHAPSPGSRIELLNLSGAGRDTLVWPRVTPRVRQASVAIPRPMQADTCVLDTERRRFTILWRSFIGLDGDVWLDLG